MLIAVLASSGSRYHEKKNLIAILITVFWYAVPAQIFLHFPYIVVLYLLFVDIINV